jgi:hypothetical protein
MEIHVGVEAVGAPLDKSSENVTREPWTLSESVERRHG